MYSNLHVPSAPIAEAPAAPKPEKVEFEGMLLPQEQVDAIEHRRAVAADIKEGIDIERINSWEDLVHAFKAALSRAETAMRSETMRHHMD
ncbi:MAG TPA: hypothetical protein VFQ72_00720 [Candidatus Paceibacterota bacterium]|nr:hypothetical protein [Candidatus Paceibacterota bacterium]